MSRGRFGYHRCARGVMSRFVRMASLMLTMLVLTGCAQGTQPSAPASAPAQTVAPRPSRALNVVIRTEPPTLTQKVLSSGVGTSFAFTQRAFNATVGYFDGQGVARPYLAETLPQLD